MCIPLFPRQIENLISQSNNLVKVITYNQSKILIIDKNLFNHMKVSK